ncbi:hypothetical protein [Planococcus donghaensis]|uniref:Uncharacterized protein n=1 Tax=Planococcus donghaensis TaxID=414778 RepID=A0A1C7EI04_9BACL|nr:hypothetical protein [Planococcus donghaensis]ANU23604.1 hypothetical protein BCM40_09545 [Planococcus donghaensis]
MKVLKNQQGYALLVVLLIVVLFFSLSATFIAGSLNHSKQEQTIDVNNHAVAAAEMGTLYFTTDFERELKMLKYEMNTQTQLKLNALIDCIKYPLGNACNTQAKRDQWEETIEQEMKAILIGRIMDKVQLLNTQIDVKKSPFTEEKIDYSILKTTTVKLNKELKNVDLPATVDKEVESIKIEMNVQGTSEGVLKELIATFLVKMPDGFLSSEESIKVDTLQITSNVDLKYENVFSLIPPTQSCSALLTNVLKSIAKAPYECLSVPGEKLSTFVDQIKTAKLDPVDFRVYTNSFSEYVCDKNCNNINFQGVSVVVKESDASASNNINNLVNARLIINGKLGTGNNLMNLGKNGVKQSLIVKELVIDGNIKNSANTNFLVLGYNNPLVLANLKWGNHIEISNNSRFCVDIDRVKSSDLNLLSQQIIFSGSGVMSYYSADKNKVFELKNASGADRTVKEGKNTYKMTDLYVKRESSYSTFLANCGVSIKSTNTMPLDVSIPVPIDIDIDLEIDY